MAEMKKKTKIKKKKANKNLSSGIVHIKTSSNNTIVTVSDANGNVISWSSAGALGYRGSKKNTPFVAQSVSETAMRAAYAQGIRIVDVRVKGPGNGRESAIRALQVGEDVKVTSIKDVSPIAHNGCRPPKKRRI